MAFQGRVAVVTGGASGMGREAALQLASAGAKVAIVDLNDEALAKVAAEHDGITTFSCDVCDLTAVQTLVQYLQYVQAFVLQVPYHQTSRR